MKEDVFDREPDEQLKSLLRACAGSMNDPKTVRAQELFAKSLELPLKKGIMFGDIYSGIFEQPKYEAGVQIELPIDLLVPGTEKDYTAYTMPGHGKIPERTVSGDYVTTPTYETANSIDCQLKYLRDARWDVAGRMKEILVAGHVLKRNRDTWRTIMAAAAGRSITVYDAQATSGLFTKALVSSAKITMRRRAGGNSTSLGRGKLTDLYISPEGLEDILNWDLTQIPDSVRADIFYTRTDDGVALVDIYGVRIHDIDEFGVAQEFQKYLAENQAVSLTMGGLTKTEFAVGLDLSKKDSFVMPIREYPQVWEDPTYHRQNRFSLYSREEYGCVVYDSRRTLLLAF